MKGATVYGHLFGKESVQTIVGQAKAQVHAIAAHKVSQLKTVRRNGCTETVLYLYLFGLTQRILLRGKR